MSFPVETAPPDPVQALPRKRRVARVLLADADLASRLAVKTILSKAGYAVSGAATAAEAIGKLDANEYQLVLADLRSESDEAGPRVLAYARQKEFRPATALIASDLSQTGGDAAADTVHSAVHISNENVSQLIERVADLISHRAGRRIERSFPKAS
jgi:CheY-like chemotaxis protein